MRFPHEMVVLEILLAGLRMKWLNSYGHFLLKIQLGGFRWSMGGIRPPTGQQVPTLSNRAEASPRARVRAGLIGTGGVLDWWMIWDISIYHFTHTHIYICIEIVI